MGAILPANHETNLPEDLRGLFSIESNKEKFGLYRVVLSMIRIPNEYRISASMEEAAEILDELQGILANRLSKKGYKANVRQAKEIRFQKVVSADEVRKAIVQLSACLEEFYQDHFIDFRLLTAKRFLHAPQWAHLILPRSIVETG